VFDSVSANDTTSNQTVEQSPNTSELNGSVDYRITATEGDVVTVPIRASDPDGDEITYDYSEPFNNNGVWQTELGDEGSYVVEVNASDGISTTQATVLVRIQRANRAPVIDCPAEFRFSEGDLAVHNCDVYDPEGDRVVVTYRGWTTSRTKQTGYDDAGNYTVIVRARDTNNNTVEEAVPVVVEETNRAPEIESVDDQTVRETSTFSIDADVSDPDGDDVDVRYTAPVGDDGIWETAYGDAGDYQITVIASDGQAETRETFTLTVEERNQAPVIRPMQNISVSEGDVVNIRPEVYDPDGDDVTIDYNGWMESSRYETTYDDAYPDGCNDKGCEASYTVFIEATDGELTTQETVTVFVEDKNRPPQFTG
jgi:translation initiation factor IF-1